MSRGMMANLPFFVLMLGVDCFVGAAIREAELPAADITACHGDRVQNLAACALPGLAVQSYCLASRVMKLKSDSLS